MYVKIQKGCNWKKKLRYVVTRNYREAIDDDLNME